MRRASKRWKVALLVLVAIVAALATIILGLELYAEVFARRLWIASGH